MNEQMLSVWRALMDAGTQCLSHEEYKAAEGYFAQSVGTARQMEVPEILAFTLRLLATTQVKLGKLEIAETGFHEALAICETIANAKGMAEAWAGMASIFLGRGLFQEAASAYERSIEVYPVTSPPLRLGMLYSDLGQAYASLEEWEKALRAYDQARQLCHIHGYLKGKGELEVLIGEIFYRQGKKKEAETCLKKACQDFALLQDLPTLANALQYLALIHYDQDELELAREAERRAVVLWIKFGMKSEASESCYFLSKIEQNLGDKEAQQYLELSIALYIREDLGLAMRYQSLAGLALTALDLPKADEYFTEALRLFELVQEDEKAGEVCETLAFLADVDGRRKEALAYYFQAVEYLKGYPIQVLDALQSLAACHEKYRDHRRALETYWKALRVAREHGLESEGIELAIQHISKLWRKKAK